MKVTYSTCYSPYSKFICSIYKGNNSEATQFSPKRKKKTLLHLLQRISILCHTAYKGKLKSNTPGNLWGKNSLFHHWKVNLGVPTASR